MDLREVMNIKEGYYAGYRPIYDKLQKKAKKQTEKTRAYRSLGLLKISL